MDGNGCNLDEFLLGLNLYASDGKRRFLTDCTISFKFGYLLSYLVTLYKKVALDNGG